MYQKFTDFDENEEDLGPNISTYTQVLLDEEDSNKLVSEKTFFNMIPDPFANISNEEFGSETDSIDVHESPSSSKIHQSGIDANTLGLSCFS